jgi:hypothetical protein
MRGTANLEKNGARKENFLALFFGVIELWAGRLKLLPPTLVYNIDEIFRGGIPKNLRPFKLA